MVSFAHRLHKRRRLACFVEIAAVCARQWCDLARNCCNLARNDAICCANDDVATRCVVWCLLWKIVSILCIVGSSRDWARSGAQFNARSGAGLSTKRGTIWCTERRRIEHEAGHNLAHEAARDWARSRSQFGARNGAGLNIWSAKRRGIEQEVGHNLAREVDQKSVLVQSSCTLKTIESLPLSKGYAYQFWTN